MAPDFQFLLLEVVSVRVAGHSALAVDSAGHVKGFDLRSCAEFLFQVPAPQLTPF